MKYALKRLNELLAKEGFERVKGNKFDRFKPWYDKIAAWKKAQPFRYKDTDDAIQPQYVIEQLYKLTKGQAILTTGVGQHQMWAAQYYDFDSPRSFITSAGLGAMGFGYPAAMGAKVA